MLSAHGVRVLWYETSRDSPGLTSAQHAAGQGADILLVSGGDGTVMACARGLLGTAVPLAILPSGTGNIIAASLRLPTDAVAATEVALHGERKRIDLCVSDSGQHFFAGSIGATAAVLRDASPAWKARAGMVAYAMSAARHVWDPPGTFRLRIDGEPMPAQQCDAVLIGHFGRLITRPRLERASLDDGLLEVGILKVRPFLDWIRQDRPALKPPRRPPLDWYQGRQVTVDCDRSCPAERDGDCVGSASHLQVAVSPRSLQICVPPSRGRPQRMKPLRSWVLHDTRVLLFQHAARAHRGQIGTGPCAWDRTPVPR